MSKTFKISPMAAIVPMATEAEQLSLNKDIEENGLREPIILWNGEIVDGRCRQKACELVGERIRFTELGDIPSVEVIKIVKSLNTRRNLTTTQKVMVACKESFEPGSESIVKLAEQWGIGKNLIENARYIVKHRPNLFDPLFNGESVNIVDKHGKENQQCMLGLKDM